MGVIDAAALQQQKESVNLMAEAKRVNAAAVKSVNCAVCSHLALIGQINACFLTFPPALCADDDASFPEDGRSFITLTCSGGVGGGGGGSGGGASWPSLKGRMD